MMFHVGLEMKQAGTRWNGGRPMSRKILTRVLHLHFFGGFIMTTGTNRSSSVVHDTPRRDRNGFSLDVWGPLWALRRPRSRFRSSSLLRPMIRKQIIVLLRQLRRDGCGFPRQLSAGLGVGGRRRG